MPDYLRRKQGDADSIAPSLYASRGVRKHTTDVVEDEMQPAAAATPSANQPTAPANNATPSAKADVSIMGPFMQ